MIPWALTYLLHSTVLILAGWALARSPWARASRVSDAIWKCALVGGLLTATLQYATGSATSVALPIQVQAPVASIDTAVSRSTRWDVPWVALVWAATAGLAALRLAAGWVQVRRAAGRRRVMAGGPLRRELDTVLRTAGVTRRMTLSCSRRLAVPRAIGLREICVPLRVLRDLSPAEQRALLAHEVAHLLRRDGLWLLIAALLQTLTWWQPLTRLAAARLRTSMELCCDDWAASRLPDRRALAECLVKVGEWSVTAGGFPVAAFAARGSALRERVARLIDPDPAEPRGHRHWLAAAPLVLVLGVAPRVTLTEPGPAPSSVVQQMLPSVASAPAPDRRDARIARARLSAEARSAKADASAQKPRAVVAVPNNEARPASRVEEPVPAPGESEASEASPIITITEPLLRPPAALRITGGTARLVPPPPARPQPLFSQDSLERRIGFWVDWQGRHPPFDPLHPKYQLR